MEFIELTETKSLCDSVMQQLSLFHQLKCICYSNYMKPEICSTYIELLQLWKYFYICDLYFEDKQMSLKIHAGILIACFVYISVRLSSL